MQEINLYNLTDDFAFELDCNANVTKIIWGNNRPLGYSTNLIIDKPIWNFLLPNATEKLQYLIVNLKRNEVRTCELLLASINKKTSWYKISITCKVNNKQKFYVVYCNNINELKKQVLISEESLEKLNQVNELNNQIIHSTQAIILVLNHQKEIESISKGAEKILGYTNTELIGKKWFETILPSTKFPEFEYGYDLFINSRQKNRVITAPVICRNNTQKTISWKTSKIISDGKVTRTVAVGKDITELTLKVSLLQESEIRFKTLAQLVQIPLSFISIHGKIIFVNKAYTNEYGFKVEEIPTVETLLNICYKNKNERKKAIIDWQQELRTIAKEKKIVSKICDLYTKSGEKKVVQYSAVLSNDYIYYSYLDITSQIKKEKILQESKEVFKRIAENTPVPIAGYDAVELKVIFTNKKFVDSIGYSFDEINKMDNWGDLIFYANLKEKKQLEKEWENVKVELFLNPLSTIKNLERKIVCKDGFIREFEIGITYENNTIYALFYDITERKKTQAKLFQSEMRFRNLAEKIHFPVVFVNAEGKFLFINKAFSEKFGYTIKDFPNIETVLKNGNTDSDAKKTGINNWMAEINKLFTSKTTINRISDIETKNGEIRRVEYSASLSDDFVFYVYSDITEQVKAEQRLKLSEEKFRNIVEYLPIPLVSLNAVTGSLFSNKMHQQLIGYNNTTNDKNTEISTFSINDLVDSKAKKNFSQLINKIRKNKSLLPILRPTYQVKIFCKDLQTRTFEITENIYEKTLYTLFHDITDRLKAEKLLKESEQKFKALAENMPIAIGGYDAEEKVIFLNNYFTKITGYKINDVPTIKDWYMKTQPNTEIRNTFYKHWTETVSDFRSKKIAKKPEIIATALCKNGKFKTFSFSFSINNENTYILITDITQEEIAKKELEKSHNELRELASYLQDIREEERKNISREIHDELGQQLTGIKMDVSAIHKKNIMGNTNTASDFKQVFEMINESIKTIRKISSQLRPSILDDLGLIAAIEWQTTEFSKRANVTCNFNNKLEDIILTPEIQLNLFRILQEALTNILRHAFAKIVTINLYQNAKKVHLQIKDNGIGFNTNNPSKTLGLLGMKERVLMLNGVFKIESNINKGTSILISIPLTSL
ncbi:MAG: PAS domain-containing sensor histidine kinase [Chitinophagaceae bacterium]